MAYFWTQFINSRLIDMQVIQCLERTGNHRGGGRSFSLDYCRWRWLALHVPRNFTLTQKCKNYKNLSLPRFSWTNIYQFPDHKFYAILFWDSFRDLLLVIVSSHLPPLWFTILCLPLFFRFICKNYCNISIINVKKIQFD